MGDTKRILPDLAGRLTFETSAENAMDVGSFDSLVSACREKFGTKATIKDTGTEETLRLWVNFPLDSENAVLWLVLTKEKDDSGSKVSVTAHGHWPVRGSLDDENVLAESDLSTVNLVGSQKETSHDVVLSFTLPLEQYDSILQLPIPAEDSSAPFDEITGQCYVKRLDEKSLYSAVVDRTDTGWFFSARFRVDGQCGPALCRKALADGARVSRLFLRKVRDE
jgi:hypothetical protein